MATTRTYGEGCAAAHALDLVGERWALLVVRELLLGPKRFTDLRRGMPSASPNVLSQRLRDLEAAGVVVKRKLPPPAASQVYELTDWGLELEPVMQQLGRWGARSPVMPHDKILGTDSFILAMRTMFDASSAGSLAATYEFRIGDDRFMATVADGDFEVVRGSAEEPDVILEADSTVLTSLVFLGGDLTEAQKAGELKLDGDRAAAQALFGSFPLPEPAAVA